MHVFNFIHSRGYMYIYIYGRTCVYETYVNACLRVDICVFKSSTTWSRVSNHTMVVFYA